jgi:hypothetical protein
LCSSILAGYEFEFVFCKKFNRFFFLGDNKMLEGLKAIGVAEMRLVCVFFAFGFFDVL